MKRMNRISFNKWVIIAIWIVVLTVLETTFGKIIKINSVIPDLLFVFAISRAALERNLKDVVCIALISGVVSDFICHSQFMGYMAVYTYSAIGMYFLKSVFIKPNIFFMSVFALIIFILAKVVSYPVFYFAKGMEFGIYFSGDAIPHAFYNMACFFVMTLILKGIKKREERYNAS